MSDVVQVRAPDRRKLAVSVSGDRSGSPVFYLHGTPGSRVGPVPTEECLYRLGVRLITFDRPGYGLSDRLAHRKVAHVAPDVAAIADYLEIPEFAVIGRSGGGPHALACAALLPDRVTRAAALVSLAPRDAQGLDWFDGMSDGNVTAYKAAVSNRARLRKRLLAAAQGIKADPDSHVAILHAQMPEADQRVVARPEVRAGLAQNFAEALRTSAYGWIDDVMAFASNWGFDVSAIARPVLLWHGERDVFSPVKHTEWLAEAIPGALARILPDRAHFDALAAVPEVLSWLIRPL